MNSSVVLAVVLGLALIGAVAVLVRTELRSKSAPPAARPTGTTGREALDTVDLALRRLAAECLRIGRDLPDVYAVVHAGERLRLRLAGVDRSAPTPWEADESGEEWTAEVARLGGASADAAAPAQPYPLAVTIGLDQGERVLVDLSRASAAIAVTGGRDGVDQLVRALITELVTGPVGRRAEVTLVGSAARAEMTVGLGLMSARLHTVATLEEALIDGAMEAWRGATGSAPASQATQVFRMIEGGGPVGLQGRTPRLFVLDAAQFPEEEPAMAGLHAADAVVVLGDAPGFGWRFTVGADGSLDTGALGLRVDTHAGRMS
ncbi:hypothetical protein ACIQU4_07945 [Streptomyces sp. NPDC090741]|uniref:hypothetical protein n=1 Tax=Streptomyces sp. NPDC090741 TaxID=3365967 RepID=UPI00381BEEDE